MSILKTTHAGSKAIPVTNGQEILDEIAKLGYTYNYALRRWRSNIQNMPDLIIRSGLSQTYNVTIYHGLLSKNLITYMITSMSDIFNLIDYLKEKYVNS
jgi:hypothetical protein